MAMAAAVLVADHLLASVSMAPRLALLVGIGALTYIGGLMLFARETIGDLIAMARGNPAA